LPTMVCAVTPPDGDADGLAAKLRRTTTPIVARIHDGRVLLDPRTVDPREDGQVESALAQALGVLVPPGGEDGSENGAGLNDGDGAGR